MIKIIGQVQAFDSPGIQPRWTAVLPKTLVGVRGTRLAIII
ncbi:MAG: hypothetical protein V7K69_17080 [Nostoc sp.]